MIQVIITDEHQLEAEAIRGEEEAQKGYEDFVKDSNESLETKRKDIENKSEAKAKAQVEKAETETERDGVTGDIKQLTRAMRDLHQSCDYLLKNFDSKQGARDE